MFIVQLKELVCASIKLIYVGLLKKLRIISYFLLIRFLWHHAMLMPSLLIPHCSISVCQSRKCFLRRFWLSRSNYFAPNKISARAEGFKVWKNSSNKTFSRSHDCLSIKSGNFANLVFCCTFPAHMIVSIKTFANCVTQTKL